jgi:hypothetical protein
VEILPSARKHGIADDDIRHAAINALAAIASKDQPEFVMLIGPDTAAHLVEVGILSADDNDYVIHAMPARMKYINMIKTTRGDPS